MGNSNKALNKVIIHYNDGKDYTIKHVTGIESSCGMVTVSYKDGGRFITQSVYLNDTLYTEYYDEDGDLHVINATNIPVKVVFKDRAYNKVMQTVIDKDGKTLAALIKEVTDAIILEKSGKPVEEKLTVPMDNHIHTMDKDELTGTHQYTNTFVAGVAGYPTENPSEKW